MKSFIWFRTFLQVRSIYRIRYAIVRFVTHVVYLVTESQPANSSASGGRKHVLLAPPCWHHRCRGCRASGVLTHVHTHYRAPGRAAMRARGAATRGDGGGAITREGRPMRRAASRADTEKEREANESTADGNWAPRTDARAWESGSARRRRRDRDFTYYCTRLYYKYSTRARYGR